MSKTVVYLNIYINIVNTTLQTNKETFLVNSGTKRPQYKRSNLNPSTPSLIIFAFIDVTHIHFVAKQLDE